jgi:hypothetical protein
MHKGLFLMIYHHIGYNWFYVTIISYLLQLELRLDAKRLHISLNRHYVLFPKYGFYMFSQIFFS